MSLAVAGHCVLKLSATGWAGASGASEPCTATTQLHVAPSQNDIAYSMSKRGPLLLNCPAMQCHLSQHVLQSRQACLSHNTVMLTSQHGWQEASRRTASQQSSAPACSSRSLLPVPAPNPPASPVLAACSFKSWVTIFHSAAAPPGTTLCLVFCMATVRDDAMCSVFLQLHEAEAGQGTAPGPWLPDA